MAPLIHVYHLLFIALKNARAPQKSPSLFCLSVAAITFPTVLPLNVSDHMIVPGGRIGTDRIFKLHHSAQWGRAS